MSDIEATRTACRMCHRPSRAINGVCPECGQPKSGRWPVWAKPTRPVPLDLGEGVGWLLLVLGPKLVLFTVPLLLIERVTGSWAPAVLGALALLVGVSLMLRRFGARPD